MASNPTPEFRAEAVRVALTSAGNRRPDGPEAGHALTLKSDHSGGADQSRKFGSAFKVDRMAKETIQNGKEKELFSGV